jgi:M6 family metalloprotease-like protein
MRIKKYIIFGLALFVLSNGYAAYLKNVPQRIVQPDGTVIHCFASGDEYHNWLHDSLGYTIIRNPQTGYYVYALSAADSIVASDYVVGTVDPVSLKIDLNANISAEKWAKKRAETESITPKTPIRKSTDRNHGHINNLVFFIRFADESGFASDAYSALVQKHNDSSSVTANSMYNFYKLASYGKFTVSTSFYPSSTSDVIYSYQDSLSRSYYLEYDSVTNPNGYRGRSERTEREHRLLKRVVEFFADSVPASLDLDFNNDGRVDNVCFITSGAVQGWNGLMWPHRWSLYSYTVEIHGKRVYDYNFVMETYTDVGVLTHEFMHTLGAPDLYRYYEGLDITPVGQWDLMATTNYGQPQGLGAYMKYKYGNWIDTVIELTEAGRYTLYPANKTSPDKTLYKIRTSASEEDYLVLDYRATNSNTFESNLPASGLLIYRINENYNGNANYNGNTVFDEVYLFRRSGTFTANGNLNHANFSLNQRKTNFDQTSSPYPFCTDGTVIDDIIITDISAISPDSIQFSFMRKRDTLEVSETVLYVDTVGEQVSFEIKSTTHWTVSRDTASWLDADIESGRGDTVIVLTNLKKNTGKTDSCVLLIQADSNKLLTRRLVVYRVGMLSLSEKGNVAKAQFDLFPNPSTKNLHIRYADMDEHSSFSIYSVTGQLIYHSQIIDATGEKIVDVSDWSAGVYFLKLHSPKNVVSKRFIKK